MPNQSATRKPPKFRSSKPVTLPVYTLGDVLHKAAKVFTPDEAGCLMGKTYCSLRDLSEWIAALPEAQANQCRFVSGVGNVSFGPKGEPVSIYIAVAKIPAHTHVTPQGDAEMKPREMTLFLTVQPLPFLQTVNVWADIQRVRPIALTDEGVKFEVA